MTSNKRKKKDPEQLSQALKANLSRRKKFMSKTGTKESSNPIIVLGSSNSYGKTREAVYSVAHKEIPLIDIKNLNISYYDYEHQNITDDFLPTIEKIIQHDLIILATPVYWYSMSAQMKTFIDRISDLLSIKKDLGRELRGKRIFVIASFSTSLPKGFEEQFSQTCEYLGIKYEGCSFIYNGNDIDLNKNNILEITKAKTIINN
jgi:putative NADPH-quinone reductase